MMWRFEKWTLSLEMWSGCFVKGTCEGRASRWAAEEPQRGFSVSGELFGSQSDVTVHLGRNLN